MLKLLEAYLTREGYRVEAAITGSEGFSLFLYAKPDLILLDIMLPDTDGYLLIQRIRKRRPTPVIFISAKSMEKDKILGFDLGSDDYITKPFSPKELIARVRAVLRRSASAVPEKPEIIQEGDIILNMKDLSVLKGAHPLKLTVLQFDLLKIFLSHPGHVFSRSKLGDLLEEHRLDGFDRTIDAHIKNLRKILGDNPKTPQYIRTVRGVGYQFLLQEPLGEDAY